MSSVKEKAKAKIVTKNLSQGFTQAMLKGLCFNCDLRKTCTWKEDRKIFCEHFQ